jgi:hypothetical protein
MPTRRRSTQAIGRTHTGVEAAGRVSAEWSRRVTTSSADRPSAAQAPRSECVE